MGLIFWEIPPGWPALLKGREKEVPGRGAVVNAFSSGLVKQKGLEMAGNVL